MTGSLGACATEQRLAGRRAASGARLNPTVSQAAAFGVSGRVENEELKMRRATFVVSLRALGYVALLSSLVSPDRLTALLRMGQREAGPVPVVLAEWMVAVGNLLGGIALLAGRYWGRWVLVVASAIGVVVALLAFVVPEAQFLRYGPPQSVWIVVYGSVGAAAM